MKNKSKENPTCTGRSVKQTLRPVQVVASSRRYVFSYV